jgi:hypothetical protein
MGDCFGDRNGACVHFTRPGANFKSDGGFAMTGLLKQAPPLNAHNARPRWAAAVACGEAIEDVR